ncbi:MAG TPA: hypothetical protein GXZ82_05545 [Firmicutes bacterium]|jgi:hypothetical protein|nr:hypothetical protein [Bacillota bacterium]
MVLLTGLLLIGIGILISFTGIGAIIGIPLAIIGILLVIFGIAGAILGIAFSILKLLLMIIFSPLLLLAWLIRALWHFLF